MAITELKTQDLHKKLNLRVFPFKTTDDIPPLDSVIGQTRAIRALEFALEMDHSGYNVFVTGMSGTGRTTIVKDISQRIASEQPVPDDWIYVYNFDDSDQPVALCLPAGRGKVFQEEMDELLRTLKMEIPATFNSEEYEEQKLAIITQLNEQKRKKLSKLDSEAKEKGIQLQNTPAGFQTLILKDGEPLQQEEYDKLSETEKEEINSKLEHMQEHINETVRDIVKLEREAQQKVRQLDEKIGTFIVNRYINELQRDYKDFPQILHYLERVGKDIITNINEFLSQTKKEGQPALPIPTDGPDHFSRYKVNVIMDHSNTQGAPLIYEPNPTYNNLFGRIEKQVVMGAQTTNHTLVKSGSLHKANGGYLITDALQILKNPFVYDALKRAIKTREIRIEETSELYGYFSAAGLKPQSIPLNLKLILIGSGQIYYLLNAYDEDFTKIFKVRADFDYETKSSKENVLKYAHFIRRVCNEEELLPFDRSGVRQVLYRAHRLVEDQQKVSLRFGTLVGIIREASYWATKDKSKVVKEKHVRKAAEEREYRHSMVEEKMQEMFERDIYRIDTSGEQVGQINGLSVLMLGDYSFGRPSRITTKTYIGNDNLVNIERKARLSGKIHDKGLMILSGFFNSTFGEHIPVAFSASLTFEQSYSMIDGDSASSTELYALISSLADVPIKQGMAVTGSVNQNGDVQAIGGVNQKIEGFYQVCKAKGLTGEQGVLIPGSNIENLMLKDEVLQAVNDGKFHVWAVDTISDGLKLLTGMDAGERKKNGKFPKDTLYYRVEEKLRTFAKRSGDFRKQYSPTPKKKNDGDGDVPGAIEEKSKNGKK